MNFYNSGGVLPPSPIGNVAMAQQPLPFSPVGNYYGNYQGYFNPWEMQRRQDEYIKNLNQAAQNQIDFLKAITIQTNETLGIKTDEEELDKMFENMKPKFQDSSDYYRNQREDARERALEEGIASPYRGSVRAEKMARVYIESEERMMKKYEGKSLEEQYMALNEIAFEQKQEEMKAQKKNFKGLYNSNDYRSLVSKSSNDNGIFRTNIDDLEIQLPSTISDEYQQRRSMFIAKLMGGR